MKYRSDQDKCYGAAGMAIALNVLDAEEAYCGICVDAEGLDCVQLQPALLSDGAIATDAREAWKRSVHHFHIAMGLLIADRVSRKMILDHGAVDRKMRNHLLSAMEQEGKTLCSLERDEVNEVFEHYFQHMVKVFSNAAVRSAVCQLAQLLEERRTLTSSEVEELLTELQII